MQDFWARFKSGGKQRADKSGFQSAPDQDRASAGAPAGYGGSEESARQIDSGPIEPKSKPAYFKWLLFLLFVAYLLLTYYHASILTGLGRYLIVDHQLRKADLIVPLGGRPVERILAAADIYGKGLAERILIPRASPPDGYAALAERGVKYPAPVEVGLEILTGLAVPASACIKGDKEVKNTLDEAKMVKAFCKDQGYTSLIVVTSPYHTRRAWTVYRKVFNGEEVRIMIKPSSFSGFKSDSWWKKGRYTEEVVIEYLKLLYSSLY